MNEATRQTLEFFIEKANKLQSLSLPEFTTQEGAASVTLSYREKEALKVNYAAPPEETVDAFVLTFRFFIQKNESISFRSLANLVNDPDLSVTWKNEFTQVRSDLNQFYDTPSPLTVNDQRLTHRDIMMTVIYGGLAHGNNVERRIFESWKSDPVVFSFTQQIFVDTLMETLDAITYIAQLNRQELEGSNDHC